MKRFLRITSVVLCVASVVSLSGCLKYTSNILDVTAAGGENVSENTTTYQPVITTVPSTSVYTTVPMTTEPAIIDPQQTTDVAGEITTAAGETQTEPVQTTAPAVVDPSSWSKEQILSFAKDAVNKTKAFTGNVSAKHTEQIELNVTKAPGGSMVQGLVNRIASGAIKPTDETLNFAGGKATNSENETVELLLPKNGAFTLDVSGIAQASAKKEGENTVVSITLVPETGSLTSTPKNNAASVGYLDASSLDLSAVTINYIDITYKGSSFTFTVNSDGYVVSAEYSVPLGIKAEGKAIGITAQIEADAHETERFNFSW